jgi:hypothetical protein
VRWSHLALITGTKHKIGEFLFAIPNGGSRNLIEAYNLKLEGVKKGVPDLMFAYPSSKYHGMFIEMKSLKGILSKEQREWIERLRMVGYKTVMCRNWENARDEVIAYLKGDNMHD